MSRGVSVFSGKPPAVSEKPPVKAAPRALQDRAAFEAKLEEFRRASGRLETYRMSFCCGRMGLPFEAVYERAGPSERFRVAAINKIGAGSTGAQGAQAAPVPRQFDIEQFSFAGWHCPYCADRSFVHCHCGQANCCGRPRRSVGFVELYKCEPGCGREMETVPMEKVNVSEGAKRTRKVSAVAGSQRPALPKAAPPLLPRTRP